QVCSALAFFAGTEETARGNRGGLLWSRERSWPAAGGLRVMFRSLPRQSSGRRPAFAARGQAFLTQAPTLPHSGTLGGGRRAFFIFGPETIPLPLHSEKTSSQASRSVFGRETGPGQSCIRNTTICRFESSYRHRLSESEPRLDLAAHKGRADGHA